MRSTGLRLQLVYGIVFTCGLVTGCGDGPSPGEPATNMRSYPVISGYENPSELGFTISPLEQNAVLNELAVIGGKKMQPGCTGTLVGDRLIVSAGHCVITNVSAWITGAAMQVATPDMLLWNVGSDVKQPLCTIEVESVHLHPSIAVNGAVIDHDVSFCVTKQSVMKTCPHVVPLQVNQEPLSVADMKGEKILQGGFGSTDGSYNFSTVRYWSLLQVRQIVGESIGLEDINQGFPTHGDSGSGALYRYPDGSLRNLAVCSVGEKPLMAFVRLDTETEFYSSVVTQELLCGSFNAEGSCLDDTVIRCDAKGFQNTDCTAKKMTCKINEKNQAACLCACDTAPFCEKTCGCDPQCPCVCDKTPGCDSGCSCDAECHTGSDGGPEDGSDGGPEDGSNGGGNSDASPTTSGSKGGCAVAFGSVALGEENSFLSIGLLLGGLVALLGRLVRR